MKPTATPLGYRQCPYCHKQTRPDLTHCDWCLVTFPEHQVGSAATPPDYQQGKAAADRTGDWPRYTFVSSSYGLYRCDTLTGAVDHEVPSTGRFERVPEAK